MKIVQIALAQENEQSWGQLCALTEAGDVWSGVWTPKGNADGGMDFRWLGKLPPIPQEEGKVQDKSEPSWNGFKVGDWVSGRSFGRRYVCSGVVDKVDVEGGAQMHLCIKNDNKIYWLHDDMVRRIPAPDDPMALDKPRAIVGCTVSGRRVWGGKGRKERGRVVEVTNCKGKEAYRIDTGHGRTVLIDAKSAMVCRIH